MPETLYKKIPDAPGVYMMKDAHGKILYIGKAGNLQRRVSSYFQKAHDVRIERLVLEIKKIDYQKTDTALEALILESELIKKYAPPFNVREKDNKSFLYVGITKEQFPRVLLTRGRNMETKRLAPLLIEHSAHRSTRKREERSAQFSAGYGPFTSASQLREALKILRRIFPWSVHPVRDVKATYHPRSSKHRTNVQVSDNTVQQISNGIHLPDQFGKFKRPCLDYELGLCPGTCAGLITQENYRENIRNLKMFLDGKKVMLLKILKKEMAAASKELDYEKAVKFRGQIFALQHIHDTALISESPIKNWKLKIGNSPQRIEGYDISNISGTSSVGSMVVFINGEPDKNEYRKFRIRMIMQSDDVGMMKEVLRRRFHNDWPLPNLILVDGGKGQINAAKGILNETHLSIPIVGLAKGPKRKRNDLVGKVPKDIPLNTLIRVRDEAHRFAISYHRSLRGRKFLK